MGKTFASRLRINLESIMKTRTVCLFGDYASDYPREVIIKRAFQKKGIKVLECNCNIKHSKTGRGTILFYLPKVYCCLIQKIGGLKSNFDYFLIPQNNRLIVPLAFLLSKVMGKRVIIDAFDLAYETAVIRGLSSAEARVRFWIEHLALHLSDHVLALTEEFKQQYIKLHSLKPTKISILPPGADERIFLNHDVQSGQDDDKFRVLYWGNFLRHHGVDIIIEAAALMRDNPNIKFIFLGKGEEEDRIRRMANNFNLDCVELLGYVSDEELIMYISKSQLCLGVFSRNIKAQCSITNKVSQALAMGKAVVTTESPATMRLFVHKENIYLVPPENPKALADAILTLYEDVLLRRQLEINGFKYFMKHFSEDAIGNQLISIFSRIEDDKVK